MCAIFHSAIDIAFAANVTGKNIMNYMGVLITTWGILTILINRPKNLAGKEKQTYQNAKLK